MDDVVRRTRRSELFELRQASERPLPVDGQRPLAPAGDELELVALDVGPQVDDLDRVRGRRPDVSAPPNATGAIRRAELLFERVRERRERRLAHLLLDEERAVGEDDELHLVAAKVRRLDGGRRVPLPRTVQPGDARAVESRGVPG